MSRVFPTISIVTPSFNQAQYLEQTINSVLNQNYPNLEYIIVDGGSTDGSVDIIKNYEKHLKFWISEKDKGQANAINIGLQYCTGKIFNWLNSDDYLASGALTNIANAFDDNEVHAVAGQTIYFGESGFQDPIQLAKLTSRNLLLWKQGVRFIQPGLWMNRSLIEPCGGIDESFHYAFDWDLVIRYLFKFPRVKYLSVPLVYFRLHENSKTVSSLSKFHNEEEQIIEKYKSFEAWQSLGRVGQFRQNRSMWNQRLSEIAKMRRSNFSKAWIVFLESLGDPNVKFSRITLGTIRRFFQNGNF
jgi:glycosyltransferase involved in cell wall biosynthesis